MKAKNAFRIGIYAMAFLFQKAGAVDFIRQIQLIEGQSIVYDTPIGSKTGSAWTKPVEGNGAILQLYAYKDDSLSDLSLVDANVGPGVHANVSLSSHLLDISLWGINIDLFLGNPTDPEFLPQLLSEKTIGTYIPETTIQLVSRDPYPRTRTRADQPYQAIFTVGKLPPTDQQLPAGAPRVVNVEQSFKLYHPTIFLPAGNGAGEGRYASGFEFSKNGTFSLGPIYQHLPGDQPTRAVGEETFTAFVRTGSDGAKSSVGSATIQVWPVATASIKGIPANPRFADVPTDIHVELVNLYPESVTYARIYQGNPQLGADGHTIGSSIISHNTYSPQNNTVPCSDLGQFVERDGVYTIEVVTVTPFNNREPERLAFTTFEIDRTIEINATTTTLAE